MSYNQQYQQRGSNRYHNNQDNINLPEFNPKWITEGADEKMVVFCNQLGSVLNKNGVSSSQLRNIYGEIMRIKQKGYEKCKTDFVLLKPKVAYNGSRLQKDRQKKFFKNNFINKVFNPATEAVKDDKTFNHFQKFFEAVLAYHKYHGGK